MQDSITKALLFVIALSTSIIAVELIPQNRVNNAKLTCAEWNSIKTKDLSPAIDNKNSPVLKIIFRSGKLSQIGEFKGDLNAFCESLWYKLLKMKNPIDIFKRWLLDKLVPYIEGTNKKNKDKKKD